jgi:hypothetical protein
MMRRFVGELLDLFILMFGSEGAREAVFARVSRKRMGEAGAKYKR